MFARFRAGDITPAEFPDAADRVLTEGLTYAAETGAEHAKADFAGYTGPAGAAPVARPADIGAQRAGHVTPFLTGLEVASMSDAQTEPQLNARLVSYGEQLTPAYEQGYGQTVINLVRDPVIIWHCEPDPCELCGPRDGHEYTVETLPGWPGDGGFGALCMGGPNCRCHLEYRPSAGGSETGRNTLRPVVQSGALNPVLTPQQHIDAWHANRAGEIRGMPDVVRPGEILSVRERAVARDIVRDQIAAERHIHPADVPARDIAERTPAVYKARSVTASVYDYLVDTYPESTLAWVEGCEWREATVPLTDIKMGRRPGGRDHDRVAAMAGKLRSGEWTPDRVVLVEDGDRFTVADGYHRTLAFRHAGRREIDAYVATPPDTAWREQVTRMQAEKLNKMLATQEGKR